MAELEATTVRKGNKKVSVTLSGWVIKLHGGMTATRRTSTWVIRTPPCRATSSCPAVPRSAQAGRRLHDRDRNSGPELLGWLRREPVQRQCLRFRQHQPLLSYMSIKSDAYGTLNWGQLSQPTDNLGILPDLSGTMIESNAVVFDGGAMRVRVKGAKNSNDLAGEFTWGAF